MDEITREIQAKLKGDDGSPATFCRRVGARVVDRIIINVILLAGIVALFMLLEASGEDTAVLDEDFPLEGVFSFLYVVMLTASSWQATVGKRLFGIHISTDDRKRLSLLHSASREFVFLLPEIILFTTFYWHGVDLYNDIERKAFWDSGAIGSPLLFMVFVLSLGLAMVLPVLFREDKKGLHDIICGTMVYKGRK